LFSEAVVTMSPKANDKLSVEFPDWVRMIDDDGQECATCPTCSKNIRMNKKSLSGIRAHVKVCERRLLGGDGPPVKKPRTRDIQQQFDVKFLEYIVRSGAVLKTADDENFRAMVHCLNPDIKLPSRKTLSRRILEKTKNHYEWVT
ncbi:hypothetical protein FOL47_005814, partial [Perkinsus chesapeaki]